jgi:hypothetical protein
MVENLARYNTGLRTLYSIQFLGMFRLKYNYYFCGFYLSLYPILHNNKTIWSANEYVLTYVISWI